MDQKALPEVLKCLSTEGFPELLAHLRDLVPGARTYSHGHVDDESKSDGGEGKDAGKPAIESGEVGLEDIYAGALEEFDTENPIHAQSADAQPDQVCGDAAHPDAVDVSLDDAFVERPSTFDAENPMHENACAPPAPDALPRPSVGIELKEIARPKPWGERPRFEQSPEELPLNI